MEFGANWNFRFFLFFLADLLLYKFFFKVFLFRVCYECTGRALHVVSDKFRTTSSWWIGGSFISSCTTKMSSHLHTYQYAIVLNFLYYYSVPVYVVWRYVKLFTILLQNMQISMQWFWANIPEFHEAFEINYYLTLLKFLAANPVAYKFNICYWMKICIN